MLEILLDIILPSHCIGCGRPVSSRQNHLCRTCSDRIPFLSDTCPVCSGLLESNTCGACSERHRYFTKNLTVMEYSGIAKEIMHGLKFKKIRGMHIILAALALKKLGGQNIRTDIITWVPMNAKKRWVRGFNQSELIAKYLSKMTGIPGWPLLREKRNMETQRELGIRDRFLNALNRYGIIPDKDINGKSVLLIDDVYTTGATINECARQLRSAGAGDVFCLTIARADAKRLEKF
jgi:competence protein ComFC